MNIPNQSTVPLKAPVGILCTHHPLSAPSPQTNISPQSLSSPPSPRPPQAKRQRHRPHLHPPATPGAGSPGQEQAGRQTDRPSPPIRAGADMGRGVLVARLDAAGKPTPPSSTSALLSTLPSTQLRTGDYIAVCMRSRDGRWLPGGGSWRRGAVIQTFRHMLMTPSVWHDGRDGRCWRPAIKHPESQLGAVADR